MHNQNQEQLPAGNLKVSREVIATIAKYSALEIEGVASLASFASNIKGWLLKKQSAKPIVINVSDDMVVIDIHINVKAGVNIQAVASKVQEAVKEAVQNMTSLTVMRVNVNIADVDFSACVGPEQPE